MTISTNKFAQLNDNGNKIYTSINTSGWENIQLSYARRTKVLAAGGYIEAEYSTDGGSSWSSLEQVNNDTWANLSFALSAATANNPDLTIRFWLHDGQGSGETAFFDNVLVTDEPIMEPALKAPARTPIGLLALLGALSATAAVAITRRKRR